MKNEIDSNVSGTDPVGVADEFERAFPRGFTQDDRDKLDVVYAFCKGMAEMMEQVQNNPMAKNMLTSMGMTVGRFANGR